MVNEFGGGVEENGVARRRGNHPQSEENFIEDSCGMFVS